jgi:DNA-binding transcriptional MerR regulator
MAGRRRKGPRRAAAGPPSPGRERSAEDVAEALARLAGSDKLYYRIGEVSELTGVKPYVLRYWESEFKWMAPGKSRSNQRLYRKQDIETILLVKRLLYEDRFTIAGAKRRLKELGTGAERLAALRAPSAAGPADLAGALREVKSELEAIRALV